MKYRRLGRTGIDVSLVSLGTGGPSNLGQRAGLAFEDQYALVHTALGLGINFFDTAAAYRKSEEILGRALADAPRDRFYVATKASPLSREPEREVVGPDDIIAQCERSLGRLGVETIDLYQLHGVLPENYEEVVEKQYPALERLRSDGKIRFIGLTEMFFSDPGHTMLAVAVPSGLWDVVMLKYGILNQAAEHNILPLCRAGDIGVLNMAAVRVNLSRPQELKKLIEDWMARGLLDPETLPADDPLGWLRDGTSETPISAGYKFAAAHPDISTVLTGTANIEHLKANVAAALGDPLPEAHARRLKDLFGHLAEGA